jgi:hypothetical protein
MIENEGAVIARLGQVAFGAGEKVTLSVDGEGLVNIVVDEALSANLAGQIDNSKSQIQNSGSVDADGGSILISSGAARNLFHSAVKNTGPLRADSLKIVGGQIVLKSDVGIFPRYESSSQTSMGSTDSCYEAEEGIRVPSGIVPPKIFPAKTLSFRANYNNALGDIFKVITMNERILLFSKAGDILPENSGIGRGVEIITFV